MIIDFHTHIFPDKIAGKTIETLGRLAGVQAASDGTLQGLLNSMNKSGVDISVIMPVCTKPEQFENINTFAQEINGRYENKIFSFGGIHPDCEDYKGKLNGIKSLGIQGIKIHPDYQKVMIDDLRYLRIIEYASELGLIILTHAGIDIGMPEPVHCPPDKMRKVLDIVKPDKMVLGHYGGWKQWEQVYEYLAGENVYLDTAFLFGVCQSKKQEDTKSKPVQEGSQFQDYITKDEFLKILNKHGANRILFATDSPWSDAKAGIQWINSLPVSEVEKRQILGENAGKLLEIK